MHDVEHRLLPRKLCHGGTLRRPPPGRGHSRPCGHPRATGPPRHTNPRSRLQRRLTGNELEPTIGVIVVNWNDTNRSLACLRSVIETRHSSLIPVLVDNGSSDDPSAAVHRALPNVRLLRLGHNLGYAAGCNAGARLAISEGAEYVLFLNN